MIYRSSFGAPVWRIKTPFEQLENMRREMERVFDNFSGRPSDQAHAGVFPAINLSQDKNNYYVRAELPGLTGNELDMNVLNNTLTISGERTIPSEGEQVRYHRRERDAGKFSRAVALPGEIDPANVAAKLANGVLTVTVPKAEKAKPRQITVS